MAALPSGHLPPWFRGNRLQARAGLGVLLCSFALGTAAGASLLLHRTDVKPMPSHTRTSTRPTVPARTTVAVARWIVIAYDAEAAAFVDNLRFAKPTSGRIRCPERRAPRDDASVPSPRRVAHSLR